MTDIALVYADFQAQFPAHAGISEPVVAMYFNMSASYISTTNYGMLRDNARELALYLLTAHLLSIAANLSAGSASGAIVSATIAGVSVTLVQPTATNEFSFWLNQTPYGQQLLALLKVKASFGLYTGGSRSQQNIRKYNGRF